MRNYTATNYPPHTLAPDPYQREFEFRPPPVKQVWPPNQLRGCPLCGEHHPTVESTMVCKGRRVYQERR